MMMFRPWIFIWFSVEFALISLATSNNSTVDQIPVPSLNSLSKVIQVISVVQDWNSEEVVVSNIDTAGAKVGKTQSYELEVQVGEKFFPARFFDELTSSRYSGGKETTVDGENSFGGLLESANLAAEAMLLLFQMEGLLKVWIEEADNLQLVMTDNNNIGVRFGVLELLTFNTELEIKLCALFIFFPTGAEFLHSTDSQESMDTGLVQGMELYSFASIVQGDQYKETKSDSVFQALQTIWSTLDKGQCIWAKG